MFIFLTLIVGGLGYFFLFNPAGLKHSIQYVLSRYDHEVSVVYEKFEGNVRDGLVFHDVTINGFKDFPAGTVLRIQNLFVDFNIFYPAGIRCEWQSGRLKFPDLEPLFISGTLQNEQLDLNAFGKNLDVAELLKIGMVQKFSYPVAGGLEKIDFQLKGHWTSPHIVGDFHIERLSKGVFLITNSPGRLDLTIKRDNGDYRIFGELHLDAGIFRLRSTNIQIEPSKLTFQGSFTEPALDLKGQAMIEKTKISVRVNGTGRNPEFRLFSDSLISQQRLMLMLATNRSWQGVDETLKQGVISPDLAKDFFDYVFLNGSGHQFVKTLGLSDISLKYDGINRGISFKKEVLLALSLGYGLEQPVDSKEKTGLTQAWEGELSMTDELTIGAERKFKPQSQTSTSETSPATSAPRTEDRIFLKYKTKF